MVKSTRDEMSYQDFKMVRTLAEVSLNSIVDLELHQLYVMGVLKISYIHHWPRTDTLNNIVSH